MRVFGARLTSVLEMVSWAVLAGLSGSLETVKGIDFTRGIGPNMVRDLVTSFGGPFIAVMLSSARMLVTKVPEAENGNGGTPPKSGA